VQVLPYWRSPVSSLCDFSSVAPRFGVALSLLGTEDDMRVRALGITVLPMGPFSKVLQMIFTPPAQPIALLCNEERTAFHSIRIGTSMVAFEPSVFSRDDLHFINRVRRTVSQAIAGTLEASTASAAHLKSHGGGAGGRKKDGGGAQVAGAGQGNGTQSAQAMLDGLMSLLMRHDMTAEELEEEQAFAGGGAHGMKPGMPAHRAKEKLQWVQCYFEENSVDYLPQVYLDTSASAGGAAKGVGDKNGAGRAAGGGGGGGAEIPPGYIGISLLCSHDFNVASQMPAGMYMTSREECESGRHAWCVCVGLMFGVCM
jgi:hypothetical protein